MKPKSQAVLRLEEKNAIDRHIAMVNDCKDRLAVLAAELNADDYRVDWKIQDDFGSGIEFSCSLGIQMPRHWMGSYVSQYHPFEEAEKSIRDMHAKWKTEEDARVAKREAEAIKQRLYEEYLGQKSTTKG